MTELEAANVTVADPAPADVEALCELRRVLDCPPFQRLVKDAGE
jgi:hypothetical protein